MSTSRAIQVATTHVLVGIVTGSVIEGLLPKFSADAALTVQLFEVLVQAGMNGALLVSLGPWLSDQDPTFGIPFSMALLSSQPELMRRVENVGSQVRAQVGRALQQMAPRVATE